jgi:hypothetical protein
MKRISKTHVALALALLVTGAVNVIQADNGGKNGQNNETRLKTKLAGAPIQGKTPEGSADFRSDSRGRSRLNVEVEHVNLPAGTMLTVSVQHGAVITNVGMITLSALGGGELELDSQDGATVPAVQPGDMVTVANGGVTILAGVF